MQNGWLNLFRRMVFGFEWPKSQYSALFKQQLHFDSNLYYLCICFCMYFGIDVGRYLFIWPVNYVTTLGSGASVACPSQPVASPSPPGGALGDSFACPSSTPWGAPGDSLHVLQHPEELLATCMPFFHTLRSSWGLYYMLMATCCMPITTQSNRNCISLLRFILSGSGSFPTKWPTFDACRPAGKEKMAWKLLLNAPTRI